MRCITCKTKFTSKRKDAKFCSPKCRLKHHRSSETDKLSVSKNAKNETDNVTDNDDEHWVDIGIRGYRVSRKWRDMRVKQLNKELEELNKVKS